MPLSDKYKSDSDEPVPVTPVIDQRIEDCLRRVTQEGLNRGTFTVNKARAAAEEELGLDAGYLKNDPQWKAKSKEVIMIAVEGPTTKPGSPAQAKPAATAGTKRRSNEAPAKKQQPRKKARKSVSDDELSESDINHEESEAHATSSDADDFSGAKPATKVPAKRKPVQKKAEAVGDDESDAKPMRKASVKRQTVKKVAQKVVEDSEASDLDAKEISPAPVIESTEKREDDVKPEDSVVKEESSGANGRATAPEDDESDMSVLIDEPPKKKRLKKAAAEPKTKSKSKTAKPAKAKPASKDLSPDEEEIKRLQSWLLKCGIRKLWHKELAAYDSPKPKIKHLKKMLEEAGMSGRYSTEKARLIKEKRELAAELEATQEYAKKWGQDKDADSGDESGEDEQVTEKKPNRLVTRKPKGLVDFGDSGDDDSD